jgi:urease gamma subunit
MSNDAINDAWRRVKTLVESMEIDIQKNAGGNVSAGVRARRGLRLLKKEAAALIKSMVDVEKNRKAAE